MELRKIELKDGLYDGFVKRALKKVKKLDDGKVRPSDGRTYKSIETYESHLKHRFRSITSVKETYSFGDFYIFRVAMASQDGSYMIFKKDDLYKEDIIDVPHLKRGIISGGFKGVSIESGDKEFDDYVKNKDTDGLYDYIVKMETVADELLIKELMDKTTSTDVGVVYIAHARYRGREMYKIGCSTDYKKRETQLRSDMVGRSKKNSFRMIATLEFNVEDIRRAESIFHSMLKGTRITTIGNVQGKTEYFKMSKTEITEIIEKFGFETIDNIDVE